MNANTDIAIDPGKLKPAKITDLREVIEALTGAAEQATDQMDTVDQAVEALKEATTNDDREAVREDRDAERETLAERLHDLHKKLGETADALAAEGLQA